jgi:hypothetical protein
MIALTRVPVLDPDRLGLELSGDFVELRFGQRLNDHRGVVKIGHTRISSRVSRLPNGASSHRTRTPVRGRVFASIQRDALPPAEQGMRLLALEPGGAG